MAKQKIVFVCSECGQEAQKWVGRCPSCGQWNTMKEFRVPSATPLSGASVSGRKPAAGNSHAMLLRDVSTQSLPRINMLDAEFNRVLGGGLVPGSLVLLGGEPGIGKSTLLLQTILRLSSLRILYVSGEESDGQIKLRSDRLSPDTPAPENLYLYCQTSLESIFDEVERVQPELLIVDSIQTLSTESVESSAGSITQIRECTASLLKYAKESATPVILVGHITKDGAIAGPKVLEHIVDTVLQFEGDRHHLYRILRSQKNRFGSTAELGIYEMRQEGLRPVDNPSELLLSQDVGTELSGVAVCGAIEGVRPLLIEVQALVSSAAYGTPQRSATGGLRVSDTAIDPGVIAAVLSSNVDTPIERTTAMAGEVGLSGEIRPVTRIQQRIVEAQRLGFQRFILPEANMKSLDPHAFQLELVPVRTVTEALRALFG